MNTIYKTYERFLEAAKKFPRWSNVKRRPTRSLGGKLLQSIIEEIGKVEDAIIEYKKDFFIVNYIGKEDTIVDYLYNAQIGTIDNLDSFILIEPDLEVTDDILEFYKDTNKAYYQDGYLVFRNSVSQVHYSYNEFEYKMPAEKFHVWNIFDEFAWWVGLERFENETNAQLLKRSVDIFRYRPNSSETGLKNVIINTLSPYGHIDEEEIKFEIPGEENLNLINDEGISLYEQISQFNRDIARTKQWDIDYWDNSFRKLGYLPHQWDAEVENYKDGVGYNNSLYVSTVKDLDVEGHTDVEIFGYKKSQAKVEEYVKNNNLTQQIDLQLTKYNNEINPVQVQYQIIASDLTEIKQPDNIYIESYQTSHKEQEYSIDSLYEDKEEVTIISKNKLDSNKEYTVRLTPKDSLFEVENCVLKYDEGSENLLVDNKTFGYNDKGLFINKKSLYHGDTVSSLNSFTNLRDYRTGGFSLVNPSIPAYCEIDVTGFTDNGPQSLIIDSSCAPDSIMGNPTWIITDDFTYQNNVYVSGTSLAKPSILTIELYGRDVYFELDKAGGASLASGYVDIETYINGKLDSNNSYYNVSVSSFKSYNLTQYRMSDISIKIKRNTATPILVKNIKASRYEIIAETSTGEKFEFTNKNSVVLSRYTGNRYLYVTINNYGQNSPVINYIHIGAILNSLNSVYSIAINTTGKTNPEINFTGQATIEVYYDGKKTDFSPVSIYKNDTKEIQGVFLDLSGFKEITYSNPQIKYGSNNRAYIELEPNQELSYVTIYGQAEQLVSRISLKEALNLQISDRLYTNKNVKGFIVKSGLSESLIKLTEDKCSIKETGSYKILGANNLEASFVSNEEKNVEAINKNYIGHFDYLYLYDNNSQNYIAYNTQNIIRNHTEGISIIKNFLPAIPSSLNVLYYISNVVSRSVNTFNVYFSSGNKWSTSSSEYIIIDTNFDIDNNGVVNTVIKNLSQNFNLSNNIQLEDNYIINDENIELGRYIIDAPEYITVNYQNTEYTQTYDDFGDILYVEEDGFNKLYHSNIVDIIRVKVNGEEISSSDYSIMNTEGIICWNNDKHIGGVLELSYIYKKPQYLTFSSLDYLYDIVGYQIDTLEQIDTINDYIIHNAENGTIINVDTSYFVEEPDKIVAECSNPCYVGTYNNGFITVQKIAEDDNIVIHNGYYYIDGNEYWYFADRYERENDRIDGVSMENVDRLSSDLIFKQEATNYLLNSMMLCNHMNVHCLMDFNYYRNIPNISSLDHISACESFSNWYSYDMNVTLGQDYDGQTIKFNSRSSDGYAILDITKALRNNKFISCWYTENLKFCLGREILISNHSLSKSLYVERYKDFNLYQDKAYLDASDIDLDTYRYYLIVTGSGTLIETLISEVNSIEDLNNDYEKTISKLGFVFNEDAEPDSIVELEYDPVGSIYSDTEIDKSWLLQTGTSADWGVTKIQEFDLETAQKTNYLYRNNSLIAQTDNAVLITNPVRINYKNSTMNLFLKINDYPYGNLADFKVRVLGSNTQTGEYSEIVTEYDTNQISIQNSKLTNYLRFEITANENQVINHIELYAQYRETNDLELKIIEYNYGSCLTKVFDTCAVGNYRLSSVDAEEFDKDNIEYEIRGGRSIDSDIVWTEWYNLNDQHVFNSYRYFQFRITLKSKNAKTRIKKFIFEVVG